MHTTRLSKDPAMKTRPTQLHLLAVALAATLLGACETAPGLDKQFGAYYEYLPASAGAVADAAGRAVREMGLQIISETDTKIVTRNAFNTKITVTIKAVGAESTKVGVRVFPGESEGLSLGVISRIKMLLQ